VNRALAIVLALASAGCGFHLRGTADLPFETIYVPNATAGVALELKRNLQVGSRARVIDDPRQAQAIMQFTEEAREKEILSLTSGGRVREFQLRYRVKFRVHDGKGKDFVPPSTIQLSRDVTYSDTAVLAKEAEEQLLYRDMQTDMVQQIVRRLAAAKRPE
jgi:LPS-assembly lipoprotein